MVITRQIMLSLLEQIDEHEKEHNCNDEPDGCAVRIRLWQALQFASDNWGRNVDLTLAA